MRLLEITFGAGFTVGLATALGSLLLRFLALRFSRWESVLFDFVAGAAVLGLAVFLVCAAGQARAAVFLAAGVPAIACALWLRWKYPRVLSEPPVAPAAPFLWRALFAAGWSLFALLYLVNALAPEASPDGAGYHLGNVLRMSLQHGFARDYHSLYASFPQGMEMLFLVAFCLGGHSSAALVHAAFLFALPLLMAAFGRRFGHPRAGLAAGLLVFASPVVGIDGSSAYNDVTIATLSFAVLYLLKSTLDGNCRNRQIVIGLLAGSCCAVKYTGALALPLALFWSPRRPRAWWWLAAGAALAAAPWLIRDWLWLGNPVAPFLNRWFPNPFYYPGPEQSYLADLRHYEVYRHWWQIPVDLAVHGASISGILGPVFLLAPLAVLALRRPLGPGLLLAAAVWTIPAYFNSGARFLIPALPFLALALCIALQNSRGVLAAAAVFQLWACWPSTLAAYAAPWSWRLRDIPVQAALRRENQAAFLRSRLPDLDFKDAIERAVLPGQAIFSYAGRPEAYLPQTIVVGYESSLGLLVQDILAQAVAPDSIELRRWPVGGLAAIGIRIVARRSGTAWWRVAEVRVTSQGGEVAPSRWRFTARPNPWQAGLAFDGSPVTRWSTWQPLQTGDFVEADFPQPLRIQEVALETSANPWADPALQIETAPGHWREVPGAAAPATASASSGMRQAALNQLKQRGIFYLWMNADDLAAQDFKQHPNQWGVTLLQEAHGERFYRID